MMLTRFAALAAFCVLCRTMPVNHENMRLFERLGLGRTADGDGSPRIRSLKTPGNSPMFFIRLPPSPYFYLNDIQGTGRNRNTPRPNFAQVPLDFTINGKPDRLYHYNLGVTPPMVDDDDDETTSAPETTSPSTTTTSTTTTTTTTTPKPKLKTAERLRQKYAEYYKGTRSGSAMKKYRYSSNGRPSSFYVMRGSSNRKPIYYRRFV